MFRRLAQLEGYQSAAGADAAQTAYNQSQAYTYNTLLPRIIPSDSRYPAPKGVEQAIRGVDVYVGAGAKAVDPVPNVGQLFYTPSSSSETCAASTLDQLIGTRDPKNPVGCAWVYTPPVPGSPLPQLSKGVLGTAEGPVPSTDLPTYKKYYWDLAQAKKQLLMDKCKALKTCSDTGTSLFGADCGYCTDLGQGVPIDANGAPLYGNSSLGYCSPNSLITPGNTANCPAPPPPSGAGAGGSGGGGAAPCTADSKGHLSAICLETLLVQGGCSDKGSFAQALSSGATPSDYLAAARTLPSMQLYNRTANPPLSLSTLSQGQLSTAAALQGFQQLAANAQQPPASALGAAARDLCLQAGAIANYDFCQDIPLSTPPPFDSNLNCLQSYFLKAGGTPSGRMYPSSANLAYYNTNFKTLGDVVNYFKGLQATGLGTNGQEGFTTGSRTFASPTTTTTMAPEKRIGTVREAFVDGDPYAEASATTRSYVSQSTALLNLQGILPDQLSGRPPHTAGIECLWIVATGSVWNLVGYTIEQSLPAPIRYNANLMLTMTDVRVLQNVPVQVQVQTNSAILALNQGIAWSTTNSDSDGYLNIVGLPASTNYQSKACWNLSGSKPNYMLGLFPSLTPGASTVNLNLVPCVASQMNPIRGLSMVREYGAPFLLLERSNGSAWIGDIQSNNYFSTQYGALPSNNLGFPSIADAALKAPGTNGYTNFPPGAYLTIPSISPTAWQAFTFAFRLDTTPVLDTFLTLTSGNNFVQVNLQRAGSSASVVYANNLPGIAANNTATPVSLNINQWYLGFVTQTVSTVSVSFVDLQSAATGASSAPAASFTVTMPQGQAFAALSGTIGLGNSTNNLVHAMSNTLSFDIAWIHFFSGNTPFTSTTIQRDARNDWQMLAP